MPKATHKQILLVEDDALIGLGEQHVLERAGYQVDVVMSGEEALDATDSTDRYDLILMDIDLGAGIDGTETARRILARREVPIVFLSSHTEPEIVAQTEAITSYGYIVKNSDDAVLLASLRMAFQLWDAHRQVRHTNDYLRAVLDTSPLGYIRLDPAGYIQDTNDAYARVIGLPRDAIVGQHISERNTEIDEVTAPGRIAARISDPGPPFVVRHRHADGRTVPLEVSARPVHLDGAPSLVAFYRDLGDQNRWEASLQAAESTATEQKTLLARLAQEIPGVVYQFRVNADGTTTVPMVSEGIREIYELTPDSVQLDPRRLFARIHPEDRERVMASIRRSETHLEDWAIEFRVVLPTRGVRWLRGHARPERLDDGATLWHGYLGDVTEDRRRQTKLHEISMQMAQAERIAGMGSWRLDIATGQVTWSDQTYRIFGFEPGAFSPELDTVISFVHPDDRDRVVRDFSAALEERIDFLSEHRIVINDGSTRWIRAVATPRVGPDDTVVETIGTMLDITADHEAMAALRQSEEKFSRMLNSSPALIGLADPDTGEIVEANEAFARTLKYSRDELIGTQTGAISQFTEDAQNNLRDQIVATGEVGGIEAVLTARDGTPVDALVSGTLVEVGGRSLILVIAIDIRRRKEAEARLETALAEKDTLMAELNHRVKNNLAMVASLVRLTNAALGDSADLGDLESRVHAITALHEELQRSDSLNQVALGPYVEHVLRTVLHGAPRPVTLDLSIGNGRVPTRAATTIGLILNELATNAVKYGYGNDPNPGFTVRFDCVNGVCELVIENSGAPIPESVTLDNPRTMGMRLVTSLVAQLNGTIDLMRSPQPRFTIRFPEPQQPVG